MIRRMLDLWEGMLVVLMTGMLSLLLAFVSYQVFARYVDLVPRYLWTEEVSRFCFVWMLFLGAAVAVRRHTHFVIDLVPEALQRRWGRAIDLMVLLVVFGCAVSMVVGGIYFVEMGTRRISTVSGIQLAWIYLAIPIAGASMILFALERIWDTLRRPHPDPEQPATRAEEPQP